MHNNLCIYLLLCTVTVSYNICFILLKIKIKIVLNNVTLWFKQPIQD